jgi:PAS domain S-box-containing protein
MRRSHKTKLELSDELTALRHRISELETFEKECALRCDAARECRHRLRVLFTKVPAMMHSIDASGHIIDVSDHWLGVMGYERKEVLGRLSTEFLTDKSRQYAEEVALVEFFKTGFIRDVPYQFVKKNGAVIETLLSAISERDRDGHFLRSTAVITDITKQKQAETTLRQNVEALEERCDIRTAELAKSQRRLMQEIEEHSTTERALQRSQRKYHALFNGAPIAYITLNQFDGSILDCNEAALRLLGLTRGALSRMKLTELFRDPETAEVLFESLRKGKAIRDVEAEIKHPHGNRLWVGVTAEPIKDHKRVVVESRLILVDITERRRTDKLLKESEERFKAIASYTYGWESWFGADGKLLWVNPGVERLTGYNEQECLQMADYPLPMVYPADRERIRALFETAVKERTSGNNEEFRVKCKRGRISWMAVSWQPIYNSDRQFIGLRSSVRDISDRKRVDERLKAAYAELERKVAERTAELRKLKDRLQEENIFLREELEELQAYGDIIAESPALKNVIRQIELVAPTDASVLILGESGTGKELVAREIHRHSVRRDRPMIKVNCATIPKELYESEFFGHVKGAFTGATRDRAGRFQAADGGSLFLDEIGEIPLELQGKLLRVLQEGEYERIGEEKTRRVNVRIIAATNQDLKAKIDRKLFREDLYYRLNVFPIEVPPLRARKEDVRPLADYFLSQVAQRMNLAKPQLTRSNLTQLQGYTWPGNVRELQNVIERAVILARSGRLKFDMPANHVSEATADSCPGEASSNEDLPAVLSEKQVIQLQRENMLAALRRCNWKVYGRDGAAQLLRLNPTTLIERIKRHGIARPAGK